MRPVVGLRRLHFPFMCISIMVTFIATGHSEAQSKIVICKLSVHVI